VKSVSSNRGLELIFVELIFTYFLLSNEKSLLPIKCFIVLHQEFWFWRQLLRKRWHFGQFLTNIGPGSPRWLISSEFNHTWYAGEFFAILWYEELLEIVILLLTDENPFLSPKSCLNNAATAIVLYQSNHQCFLVMAHSQRKVEMQYCDKRLSFLGVTAHYFSCISIDFHPKEAIEFIATTAVFWWELVQHIMEISKLFWRCWFLHWKLFI